MGDTTKKYDGLSSSTLNLNKSLIELPLWNRDSAELKNKWITQASLALVSKEWVETGQVGVTKIRSMN